MKIHIVGGGPGGLFFAILMKVRRPDTEVVVFERNRPDDTFGWGVVFSRQTMRIIESSDPETHRAIAALAATWEDVVVAHRDEVIHVGGNHFQGVARIDLLRALHRRAESVGVQLEFEHAIDSLDEVSDCDLVLGADGVQSFVRQQREEAFRPTVEARSNRYIWLGTEQPFAGLTLTFREDDGGVYAGHSYRFCADLSTFIVEVDAATFEQARLGERSDEETLRHLEQVFARDLGGHALLSNHSRWIQFRLVRTARWYDGHVALIGDACHTVHFSIGSGTKQAMEDGLALADALCETPSVTEALPLYDQRRRPIVDDLQKAAVSSLHWFETFRSKMGLSPLELTADCMGRSEKLDLERLRQRDPVFVARLEASRAAST